MLFFKQKGDALDFYFELSLNKNIKIMQRIHRIRHKSSTKSHFCFVKLKSVSNLPRYST